MNSVIFFGIGIFEQYAFKYYKTTKLKITIEIKTK